MSYAWLDGNLTYLFSGGAILGGGALLINSKDVVVGMGKTVLQKIQNDYKLGDYIEVTIGMDSALGIIVEQDFFRTVLMEEDDSNDVDAAITVIAVDTQGGVHKVVLPIEQDPASETPQSYIIHRLNNAYLWGHVKEHTRNWTTADKLEELLKALKAHEAKKREVIDNPDDEPPTEHPVQMII